LGARHPVAARHPQLEHPGQLLRNGAPD
jgi:hypothetical protein